MDPIIGGALIGLLPSILSLLFGGGKSKPQQQTQTTTSETTNPKYRSPALGIMEPAILNMLLGNANAMGGFGMPGGVSRFGPDFSSMMGDIVKLLGKEWPTIMSEYQKPVVTPAAACAERCKGIAGGPGYQTCISQCQGTEQA